MTDNKAKILQLLNTKTHEEVSIMIGISRPTLYKRIATDKWKKAETAIIKTLLK